MNLHIGHTALSVDHFKRGHVRVELSPLTRPIFTNCLFSYDAAAFGCFRPTDVFAHECERAVDVSFIESSVDLKYCRLCVHFRFLFLVNAGPNSCRAPVGIVTDIARYPDARPANGPEIMRTTGKESLVAGRPWVYVGNVSRPTMTVHAPKGKNTGVAVVVFPGGGYSILAIDLEGTEVCDWLTSAGITCVLLKYRVPGRVCAAPVSGPSNPN